MGSSWSYDPSLAMARSPTPREGFASRGGFSAVLVPLFAHGGARSLFRVVSTVRNQSRTFPAPPFRRCCSDPPFACLVSAARPPGSWCSRRSMMRLCRPS